MLKLDPDFARKLVDEFKTEWITEGITETSAIDYLENFGFFLCDKKSDQDRFPGYNAVTTSQMRNIFSEIKRIGLKEDWIQDFLLLRPKIAYNTARVLQKTRGSRIKELKIILEKAHAEVNGDKARLKNFEHFMEGIIAYHKVYGGKD
jgi:CRISPR-associated protein Csm2